MREGQGGIRPPRLVAWETTRVCNLVCRHCRAEAISTPPADELSLAEARQMLGDIAAWPPPPMVILSGGEPLMRPDILDLAAYGASKGLRMLLSTNGALLTPELTVAIKKAGVVRLSLSLDGPTAAAHDDFRGVPGAFDALKRGAAYLREARLPFQVNTTLTADNLHQANAMTAIAEDLGAVAHHIFLLVPVGRAENMETLSAEEYESALRALKKREAILKIEFKATCAPQYQRIGREMGLVPIGPHGAGRGCLAGQGFMFVGSTGQCQGCGYLPLSVGNVREKPIREIYETSPLFQTLREQAAYHGKCGSCEYWKLCGGCRARAHAKGDYLGPEPLCPHRPKGGAA